VGNAVFSYVWTRWTTNVAMAPLFGDLDPGAGAKFAEPVEDHGAGVAVDVPGDHTAGPSCPGWGRG
jgi:hypothetical protein